MTTQSLLFGGPAPIDAVHLPTHAVQPSKSEFAGQLIVISH